MNNKRITILSGHYGSGKTNIAVNLAFLLKKRYDKVVLADIDIVNPYYRAKDSEEMFRQAGIKLISSPFANSNLDVPALPSEMLGITADRSQRAVLDVGGDDRGALALGRLTRDILDENDYEMLLVVNKFRPLTRTADDAVAIMREIETAGRLPFTGIVNNTNIGRETTASDILSSVSYADEIAKITGLPVVMTAVTKELMPQLDGKILNLFPLSINHII